MSDSIDVKVRESGYQGYIATGGGQRASCSWSPEEAARRVAAKLFGDDGFELFPAELSERDAEKGVLHCFKASPRNLGGQGHDV